MNDRMELRTTQDATSRGSNGVDHREVSGLRSPPPIMETATVYKEPVESSDLDQSLKTKFLELEYTTLRTEIENSRERGFKIMIGGVLAVPGAQFLAHTFEISIFKLFLPFIVICFYLLWLTEHLAIGRCADYILTIEDQIPEVKGWEHWLEDTDKRGDVDKRAHERHLGLAFNFLSGLFYVGATFIAVSALFDKDDQIIKNLVPEQSLVMLALIVLVLYIGLGMVAAAFIHKIPRGREANLTHHEHDATCGSPTRTFEIPQETFQGEVRSPDPIG